MGVTADHNEKINNPPDDNCEGCGKSLKQPDPNAVKYQMLAKCRKQNIPYIVLKSVEFISCLTEDEAFWLNQLILRYKRYRAARGVPELNKYIVINRDEAYINEIEEVLRKNGVNLEEPLHEG